MINTKSSLYWGAVILVGSLVGYYNYDAHAQVVNPGQPTTAGTGLIKTGTALNVIYGTASGTSTQGNDIRLPTANGTSGYVLTSNGVSSAPTYQAGGGGGAVTSVFTQTGAVPNLSGDVSTSGSSVTTLATVPTTKGGTGLTGAGIDGNVLTAAGGVWTSAAPTTGSGTVGAGLAAQLAYYMADGTTVIGWPFVYVDDSSDISNLYVGDISTHFGGRLNFVSSVGTTSLSQNPAAPDVALYLPSTVGTNGYPLIGDGAGGMEFGVVSVGGGGTGDTTLTANGILFGNDTDPVGVTAVGNAGQVLTSNGTGVAPTFQNAPGGGLTLIGTFAPANSTSYCIDFSNSFSSTYDDYKIVITDVDSVSSSDNYLFSPGYSGAISNTGGDAAGTFSTSNSGTQVAIAQTSGVWNLMPATSTSNSIGGFIEITGANNTNGYGYTGFAQISYLSSPISYSRFNFAYSGANVLTGGAICRSTQTGSVYLKTTSRVKVYGYQK